MKHKLLDLFSGIGGFSLGAEANGIPTVAFVEKDPFCQKVLRKHWSNTPIISDIRTVKGEDYETDGVTIISGGFPCQPFSQAGKRKGKDDDRYLWDETIRVVAETKPEWFIGENVDGLVNIQDGLVLRQVQDDLEKEGFQVQCLVIPASGIGAWHQRKRVWIIAHNVTNSKDSGCSGRESQGHSREGRQILSNKQEGREVWSETEGCHRGTQDVSNTNDPRDRASEHGTERQGNKTDDQGRQGQSQSKPSRHSQDVSNTIGELSDGCSGTTRHSESKLKGMVSNETKNGDKVRSETERCGEQATSRGNVSDTNHSRFQDWSEQCEGQSTSSQQRESSSSRHSSVSDTNESRLQRHNTKQKLSKKKLRFTTNKDDETRKTWWQVESTVCGVPDGVSYGLDKGRVGRIKALGNSIVPQIAYQLFKSIVTVTKEDNHEQVYWC